MTGVLANDLRFGQAVRILLRDRVMSLGALAEGNARWKAQEVLR